MLLFDSEALKKEVTEARIAHESIINRIRELAEDPHIDKIAVELQNIHDTAKQGLKSVESMELALKRFGQRDKNNPSYLDVHAA
jgi:archaellum component FlaC